MEWKVTSPETDGGHGPFAKVAVMLGYEKSVATAIKNCFVGVVLISFSATLSSPFNAPLVLAFSWSQRDSGRA